MGLITGFFHYVLFELSLYTITSTREIWLSLFVHSMPCTTAYTGLGFDVGWLVCDWLIDCLLTDMQHLSCDSEKGHLKNQAINPQNLCLREDPSVFCRCPELLGCRRKHSLCRESTELSAEGNGSSQLEAAPGTCARPVLPALFFYWTAPREWAPGLSRTARVRKYPREPRKSEV